MEYVLIRSARKTIGLQWKDGQLLVRAPLRTPVKTIERMLVNHQDWVIKQQQKERARSLQKQQATPLTKEELCKLYKEAKKVFPQRVEYYANLLQVTYGTITVRCQKTRWGSCSSKGNLNFNVLLLLAPPEVLDSVVVHELCHRKAMNHQKKFYQEIDQVFPGYKACHKWLKDHGDELQAKLPRE